MRLVVGSLVESQSQGFKGVGKILSISVENKSAIVGFFISPLEPYGARVEILGTDLKGMSNLYEQTLVYCQYGKLKTWRAGFYNGERPNEKHLIIFDNGERDVLSIEDLFVPNNINHDHFSAAQYLAGRAVSPIAFWKNRTDFIHSYIEQRAACLSISSIPSSSVNLEIHQLSVVMQVLNDQNQKYLLGDEVGLGKTIEAGFLIREHILELKDNACVFIITPDSLVKQWESEMRDKFHLEDVMEGSFDDEFQKVFIGSYNQIVDSPFTVKQPTMVVIDEGHNLSEFAWNEKSQHIFQKISEVSEQSLTTIILSGTPIAGNAKSFLAMLHCLNQENYPISEEGLIAFNNKVEDREKYSGIYSALTPETDDFTVEGIIEEIEGLGLCDPILDNLIENLKPQIDFFSEEKDEMLRCETIKDLQRHFGEKYRLFQRFIRNRRGTKNSFIEQLFPGLGECKTVSWKLSKGTPSLDEQLDDYRKNILSSGDSFGAIKSHQYLELLDKLLDSPLSLISHIELLIANAKSDDELDALKYMQDVGPEEQKAKDSLTAKLIEKWLNENNDGKIVVFCDQKNVADELYNFLATIFDGIERHCPGTLPKFNNDSKFNLLILDKRGEDGLNLQGTKRLAIHYCLPRSVVRIEQRIGRLNRYSATSIGMRPIENIILTPSSNGFIKSWAMILKDSIGVFNENTASVQLSLEKAINDLEPFLISEGYVHLERLHTLLVGESGLITKERKKVADQEVWNEMQIDLSEIKNFAETIQKMDLKVEESNFSMQRWIKQSLNFSVAKTGDSEFVFQYKHGRTRLNVDEFISHCILGMDFDSGMRNPSTKRMTPLRDTTSSTGAYPLRYGQPFIDTIYEFSKKSPLGLASSIIRQTELKLLKPKSFIKLDWMVSLEVSASNRVSQRNLDRKLPPYLISEWVDEQGQPVRNTTILNLLDAPIIFSNKSDGQKYVDHQVLNTNDIDTWEWVDSFFPQEDWQRSILSIVSKRESAIIDSVYNEEVLPTQGEVVTPALVSALVMILVGV